MSAGRRAGGARGFDRLEQLAAAHPVRVGRYDLAVLAVRGVRRAIEVRVTGLAAEMTYYALISLLPLTTALGAALGFMERLLGADRVARIESAIVRGLGTVFEEQLTDDVLAPLVGSLLREERTGVALGSVAVAVWLASRMFRAAIRALDDAYRVPERRGLLALWGMGLGMSLGAVVTVAVVLAMIVVGPLLGGGRRLAEWLGQGQAWDVTWAVLRWPVVAVVSVAFLGLLYHFGPNVRTTWRQCLPGAVVGTLGLVVVAIGFRSYLAWAGSGAPDVGAAGQAVRVAAQVIGMVLASVLWVWLSSIVVLTGGVVNAELQRMRGERAVPAA